MEKKEDGPKVVSGIEVSNFSGTDSSGATNRRETPRDFAGNLGLNRWNGKVPEKKLLACEATSSKGEEEERGRTAKITNPPRMTNGPIEPK